MSSRKTGSKDSEKVKEKKEDRIEYIVIKTGEKSKAIRSESDVWVNNSKVIKDRIEEEETLRNKVKNEDRPGMDKCSEWLYGKNTDELELEYPGLKYKDVKTTMKYLNNIDTDDLSKSSALQILPVVKELELKRLKRKCDGVLLASLKCIAEFTQSDLLEHLGVAEKYELRSLRKFCVEEASSKYTEVDRKRVVDERHVEEKTKVEILDKMLNKITNGYEISLQQIRSDMDKRCRAIEKSRDEYMELTDAWKTDLSTNVTTITKADDEVHKKLLEDAHQKELFEGIWVIISEFNNEVDTELKKLNEEVKIITDSVRELYDFKDDDEQKEAMLDRTVASMENKLGKMSDSVVFKRNVLEKRINDLLRECNFHPTFKQLLNANTDVHSRMEELTVIDDEKNKLLSELEVKLAKQEIKIERAEAEIRRLDKSRHEVNTWVKWAKPETDRLGRCTCYRHSISLRTSVDCLAA